MDEQVNGWSQNFKTFSEFELPQIWHEQYSNQEYVKCIPLQLKEMSLRGRLPWTSMFYTRMCIQSS